MYEVEAFPAASLRRRVLIAVLAVAAAGVVMYLMLRPVKPVPAHLIPDPHRCQPGQTTGCVGGKAMVINPPAGPTSAAR